MLKRRLLVTVSGMIVWASLAQADDSMPFPLTPPPIDAASWVLMDATTGQILTAGNPDEERNPASLTKLMTGYVVDRAVDQKKSPVMMWSPWVKMPGRQAILCSRVLH